MLTYSVLHGSYGLLWYTKHLVFPDESLNQKTTILPAILCWLLVLLPYCVPAYLIASGVSADVEPVSLKVKLRYYIAITLYIFGTVMMMLAD